MGKCSMDDSRDHRTKLLSDVKETFDALGGEFRHLFMERLRPYHLTIPQYLALDFIVLSEEPVSLSAVGAEIGAPPSSMTSVADRLEQDGLIARQPHPTDRRSFTVEATARGKDLVTELHCTTESDLTFMLEGVDEPDLEQFVVVLRHFHQRARELLNPRDATL